jgi:hypothetical protein
LAGRGDSQDHSVVLDVALHHDSQVRSADRGDSPERLVVLNVALHHDSQVRSADRGDSPERWAVQDEVLRRDSQVRSVVLDDSPRHLADPYDWLVRLVVPDERRGQSDSDHRGLHVATAEPELAVRREPF